jgi:galactokinase
MAGEAARLSGRFSEVYGAARRVRVFRGPGRVNLIGEHTDYNLGFVLPMALDLACFVAVAPGGDGLLRAYSDNLGETRQWALTGLPDLRPARDWGDYVAGVAREVLRAGYTLEPVNLLIASTVPVGSGLSSSAALEVATALALLGDRTIEGLELARLCRRAENDFVGMPCGIMDQYVSVFGRESSAVKIDCRSLEHELATLPAEVEIVAVNTMVKHELGQSAYRNRVRECGEAVEAIRRRKPDVASLRDVSAAEFEALAGEIPEVPRKRARHVVTENQRVEEFIAASRGGDLARMGELFVGSHRSLQHDYEVSCEELDFLVDAALAVPGVLGARMTGGGFGGCTVSLLRPEAVEEFQTRLTAAYGERFKLTPQIFRCHPSAGAGEIL